MMTTREEAFDALESAIHKLMDYANEDNTALAIDAVLLVGVQEVDDDGDRCGWVNVFPRNGCQPGYITDGLIHGAIERLRKNRESTDD